MKITLYADVATKKKNSKEQNISHLTHSYIQDPTPKVSQP